METLGAERLVHLDMKRCPLKVDYLEKLFPLFHCWGATGLVVEWEDTFPYRDGVASVGSSGSASAAYTEHQIDRINHLAADNNLQLIPLVQTFGHLEFVLRHEEWSHLREVDNYPSSICPSQPESLELVTSMISQVVAKTPQSTRYFHIGADEVWHLGMCYMCSEQDRHLLFLSHVSAVLRYMKQRHPNLRPIMWDDMLRNIDIRLLSEYELGDLVDPMIWMYEPAPAFHLSDELWDKYTSVFKNIWVASAYKGATGSCQILPIVQHHISNHEQWIRELTKRQPLAVNLNGIALTGWSRYDHYATLCELLPTALPCLALCLTTWRNGGYDADVHNRVVTSLGYVKVPLPMSPYPRPQPVAAELKFPGWKIAVGVEWYANLNGKHLNLVNSDQVSTWMNCWHVKHNFTNPMQTEGLVNSLSELCKEWDAFEAYMAGHMSEAYYDAATAEWLYTRVHTKRQAAKLLERNGERLLAVANTRPTGRSGTITDLADGGDDEVRRCENRADNVTTPALTDDVSAESGVKK